LSEKSARLVTEGQTEVPCLINHPVAAMHVAYMYYLGVSYLVFDFTTSYFF
jgi:hypothetical protein